MHPNANCNCRYADVGCDKMEEVMDQISGKWKMRILFMVGAHGTLRYGELRPMLPRQRRKHLRPPPAIPPPSSAMCWMALWIFPPTRQAAA